MPRLLLALIKPNLLTQATLCFNTTYHLPKIGKSWSYARHIFALS
jgi:hypothetical protein